MDGETDGRMESGEYLLSLNRSKDGDPGMETIIPLIVS